MNDTAGHHKLPKDTFCFATQYYRMVPLREDWDRDLARIREIGFDTIRMWALWQWAEQKPGDIYLDDLHGLLRLAKKHGLDCIVVTVLDQCPHWVIERVRAPVVSLDGQHAQGVCWDAPKARELGARYLNRLCDELGGYDHLKVWDIWNEATKPECRCEHTRRHFIRWLRARYGTVAALNRATHETRCRGWGDVQIPFNYWQTPMWMLYQEFRCQAVAEQVGWAYDIVKTRLPQRSITVHCHCDEHPFVHDPKRSQRKVDWDDWALGRATDFYITGEHEFYQGEGAYSRFANMGACVGNLETKRTMTGGQFWSTGLSGGASKISSLDLLTPVNPKENLFSLWTCVAHEARGTIYWQYRVERLRMPEAPGWGLTSFDGGETYRLKESRQFIRALRPHEGGLMKSRVAAPKAAVLYSLRSHILNECHLHLNYISAFEGACFALWANNVTFDVLNEDGDFAPYDVVCVPMAHSLAPETVARLLAFVKRGGKLVIEAATASSGPTGMMNTTIPGFGLAEAAGIREQDILYDARCAFRTPFGRLEGVGERRIIEVDTAKVEARYDDKRPAVTRNRWHAGEVVYFSTNVTSAIRLHGGLEQARAWLRVLGVKPEIEVSPARPVTARVLEGDDARFVFVFNHSPKATRARVRFPFALGTVRAVHQGGSTYAVKGRTLAVAMEGREALVLRCAAAKSRSGGR